MASSTNAMYRRLTGWSLTTLTSSRIRGVPSILSQCFVYTNNVRETSKSFLRRSFSTAKARSTDADQQGPTFIQPKIIHTEDGRKFAAFDTARHPKLKPHIVKRRLNRMRTYEGAQKNIRHSPWRLNLVCQLTAGLPLSEALTQLEFCKKRMAPLVQKVLNRTSNLADIRHGLQQSQLEVAECFATKGTPLKRVKIMGRGRTGRKEHRHAHFRVVLREIDFRLRIYQAPTLNQKKKWFLLQQRADREGARAQAEREEIARLERETAKIVQEDK
jgi:large subunit ribosomal protein L22